MEATLIFGAEQSELKTKSKTNVSTDSINGDVHGKSQTKPCRFETSNYLCSMSSPRLVKYIYFCMRGKMKRKNMWSEKRYVYITTYVLAIKLN